MAQSRKNRKRKGKVKVSERVRLVNKNEADATRVAQRDTTRTPYPQAPTKVPTNGAVFRVKVRRKQ